MKGNHAALVLMILSATACSPRTPLPPAVTTLTPEQVEQQRQAQQEQAPEPQAPAAVTEPLVLDAMVGQVNGNAIYASRIFADIDAQLRRLGQDPQIPRPEFRQRATELIVNQLRPLILNELLLGEAERDLSDQEQFGLQNYLKARREELLRQFRGSLALANTGLRESSGMDLEETLKADRKKVIVRRYVEKQVIPKINVTRRDIERYYRDHYDEYNPPPGRLIRLIQAGSAKAADKIQDQLAQGVAFEKIASDANLNVSDPQRGGLFSEKPITGNRIFGEPLAALNDAVLKLKPGEHTPRIDAMDTAWWAYLESESGGETKSLRDVQLEIHRILREQQYRELTDDYYRKLMRDGSVTNIDQMLGTLLDIAMNRYAKAE